jgi:isopenicillin N synthase-like dioxygenase
MPVSTNGRVSGPPTVSVTLHDLQQGNITLQTLEDAFGPDSLGIIIVTGLPPGFAALRKRLLSLSSYLANLPSQELEKLEKRDANYAVGWSCGKETLADGRYDTLKGSYYAQPIHNAELEAKSQQLYPHVPEFTSKNVWPAEDVLPGFAKAFEELCRLIVDVAGDVARNCDRYGVAKLDGYKQGTLEKIVRESVCTKARLLHYFPPPAQDMAQPGTAKPTEDDWCATHKDLGALTGLTSQMFIDEAQRPAQLNDNGVLPDLPELDAHPDPKAGLWIQDRSGRTTQVHIPRDALAFQTGEALELITRGSFKAVPHYVRGGVAENNKIARNTLAVFTQPNLWVKSMGVRMIQSFANPSTLGGKWWTTPETSLH